MRNQDCTQVEYGGRTDRVLAVNERRIAGRLVRSVVLDGPGPISPDFYEHMRGFFGLKPEESFTVVRDYRGQGNGEAEK